MEGDPARRRARCASRATRCATGGCPFRPGLVDWLALAFAALVVVYALDPAVGARRAGRAPARSRSALRHDVVPVGAYFLGRSLVLAPRRSAPARAGRCSASPALVAALGLVDVYAVSIGWWRTNGVIDYFHRHLGYDYHGTGGGSSPTAPSTACRRTSSTTSAATSRSCAGSCRRSSARSRAATSSSSRCSSRPRRCAGAARGRALGVVAAAGLLWTFSRSSLVALAAGLVVLARRAPPSASSSPRRSPSSPSPSAGRTSSRRSAPTGNWTKVDLTLPAREHREDAAAPTDFSATSANEPSLHSHWVEPEGRRAHDGRTTRRATGSATSARRRRARGRR